MAKPLRIAVVIPYFQRKPGLISACVQSILRQQGAQATQILVVDDEAPAPAWPELEPLLRANAGLQVVRRPNTGPGGARNDGLNLVAPGTEVVAFIDSDDCWTPDFLATAVAGFHNGADLFFGNSRRYGQDLTRFEWSHPTGRTLDLASHELIDPAHGLYRFKGDFFDFAIYRSAIISTSTLAYRFDRFRDLRFHPGLFNGQDRYFKLQLAKAAATVTFSTRVCAEEGQGVNIFDSSGWGSQNSLRLSFNYIKLAKAILGGIALDESQRRFVESQREQSRDDFARSLLHSLRAHGRLQPGLIFRSLTADPMTLMKLIPNIARAALGKSSG